MLLRRRATPLGQRMISAALACGAGSSDARYILASRHGEFSRLLTILQSVAKDDLPSPGEFSMSVHHALTGLLSIHANNRQGHTAISAGFDTFGMALLEAVACIAEAPGTPIVLMYGDQPLPEPYVGFQAPQHAEELVLALGLTHAGPGDSGLIIDLAPMADRTPADQPACIARDFLQFFLSDASSGRSVGDRAIWRWTRHG